MNGDLHACGTKVLPKVPVCVFPVLAPSLELKLGSIWLAIGMLESKLTNCLCLIECTWQALLLLNLEVICATAPRDKA